MQRRRLTVGVRGWRERICGAEGRAWRAVRGSFEGTGGGMWRVGVGEGEEVLLMLRKDVWAEECALSSWELGAASCSAKECS